MFIEGLLLFLNNIYVYKIGHLLQNSILARFVYTILFDGYFSQSEMHFGPDIQWEREFEVPPFEVSLWKSAWEEFSTERWLPCRRLPPCSLSIYWSRKVRVGNRSCKITSIFRKIVVLWSHVKWRLFIKY